MTEQEPVKPSFRYPVDFIWCITHNCPSEGRSRQRSNCRWVQLSYTSDDKTWQPKKS